MMWPETVRIVVGPLFAQGGDSNAGFAYALDLVDNVVAGFEDNSFLGNTWVGCHTEGNGRCWIQGNDIAYSLVLGCYAEANQLPPMLAQNSLCIGGDHFPCVPAEDGTFGLDLRTWSNIGPMVAKKILSVGAEPVTVSTYLGRKGASLSAFGWQSSREDYEFDLQLDRIEEKRWDLFYAGRQQSMLGFHTQAHPLGAGSLSIPTGYYIGQGASARWRDVGDGPPTTEHPFRVSGFWLAGDRRDNVNPSPGGPYEWVCVESGNPGSWESR